MVRRYCLNCANNERVGPYTKHYVKSTRFDTVYECTICGTQEHEQPDNCVAYPNEVESSDPDTEQVPAAGIGWKILRYLTGQ